MRLSYETVVSCLIEAIPEFKPVLDRHIEEYGEVLPHVLFGELTLWVIELFKEWQQTQKESDYEIFSRVIHFVKKCTDSEDQRVNELALFSFLENLWQSGEYYQSIRLHLEPELQFWLDRIERWWERKHL